MSGAGPALLGGLVLCAGFVGACGAEPSGVEEPGARARRLKGAELAPEASQVVAVVNFAGGQCSGAPIARDLVLTARHCIGATNETSSRVVCSDTTFTDPDSAGAMFVLTTATVTDDPRDYRAVREVRMLPGDDPHVCGQDIALLRLERPLDVEPLIPRVDVPVAAGEAYTAYGFGDDEGDEGAGVRRKLDGLSVACVGAECPDREVFETEWVGANGVCSGDSGGPALDAEGRVIGAVSRGYTGCRSPVYGSVSAFGEFLKSEALLAAEAGGYEAPAWARGYSTEPRFYRPVGAPCEAPTDCPSGICGLDGTCTRECSAEGPCPSDYLCDEAGYVCVRAQEVPGGADPNESSKAPGSSCAFARGGVSAAWLAGLGLWFAIGVRRRSARAGRVVVVRP